MLWKVSRSDHRWLGRAGVDDDTVGMVKGLRNTLRAFGSIGELLVGMVCISF